MFTRREMGKLALAVSAGALVSDSRRLLAVRPAAEAGDADEGLTRRRPMRTVLPPRH